MGNQVEKDDIQEDEGVDPTENLSPIEQKAYEQGWRPLEEFEGDEDEWVSAKEFVGRQSFFDKIKKQNAINASQAKEIAEMKEAMKRLGEMNRAVRERALIEARAELEAQKRQAFEEQDYDAFHQAEKEIKKVEEEEEELKKEPVKQEPQGAPEEYLKWEQDNPWYTQDPEAAAVANARARAVFAETNDLDEALEAATEAVRKRFPEHFQNPKRSKAAMVDSGNDNQKPTGKRRGPSRADLSPEEQRMMDTICKASGLTEKEYLEQYMAKKSS